MLYRNSVTIILMLLLSISFITSCEYATPREILTAMSTDEKNQIDLDLENPDITDTPVLTDPEPETPEITETEPDETTDPVETEPPFILVHRYVDGIKQERAIKVYNTLQGFLDDERYEDILTEARAYNAEHCGQTRKSTTGRDYSITATSEELATEILNYMLENHPDDIKLRRSIYFTSHNDPENFWIVPLRARCG